MSRPRTKHVDRLFVIGFALLGLCVVAALIWLRLFVYLPFGIYSVSMSPTFYPGDIIAVSRHAYNSADPARGDVIVFSAVAANPGEQWVKRIVGLPGDRVQMKRGVLLINGRPVPRKRLSDIDGAAVEVQGPVRQFEETLPAGRAYRTLDQFDGSPADDTAIFLVPEHTYFVIGDNRDNSIDSRNGAGFIRHADIIGKTVLLLRNRSGTRSLESVP
jgi:signal peptidase I